MSLAVSRAEANLLTVARVAVGVVPAIDAMRLLAVSVTPPQKLGPTARAALADTLSRGTVLSLARQGGWLPEGEKRLWERHEAVPLHFSGNAVRLLAWMLETPLSGQDAKPLVLEGDLTPAEDFLVALALDRLRGTGCDVLLARQLGVRRAPLSTLTHAAFLAHELPLDEVPALELARHGVFLEGMRVLLARAWLAAERWKRELAGFLIDVGLQWLTPDQTALELTRSLTQDAPLRERTEARRRAAATLRALGRLRAWHDEARNVRFIDDGYDAAQRLVADWDRLGEPGFARAAALVAELDAIPTLQPAAS